MTKRGEKLPKHIPHWYRYDLSTNEQSKFEKTILPNEEKYYSTQFEVLHHSSQGRTKTKIQRVFF